MTDRTKNNMPPDLRSRGHNKKQSNLFSELLCNSYSSCSFMQNAHASLTEENTYKGMQLCCNSTLAYCYFGNYTTTDIYKF